MKFDDFLNHVHQLKTISLTGIKSQLKMAPEMRKKFSDERILKSNPKKAAVLALFYPNSKGDTYFLLTKRASYNGTHSAQISFPGGKIDDQDINLKKTALRETFEEVGVPFDEITIIREITNVYIPPSNFLATPFIGVSQKKPNFITNNEVDELIEVNIKDLLNNANVKSKMMSTSYMNNIEVPYYHLNNQIVWGATGMILSEIKDLINNIHNNLL